MLGPLISHVPCDLNQQKTREDARRDSVAREIERRRGKRFLLDRLLRRSGGGRDVSADDLRERPGEDVLHSLRF